MTMRISGLASGLDTDSMVQELMSAHSIKKTNVEKQKTKVEWTQQKWSDLNSKIYKLYTDQVSKMRLQATYKTKSASSSNDKKVTVSAGVNAPSGTHTLKVNKLASSQYVTGADIKDLGLTSSSKLTDIKDASGNSLIAENTAIDITVGTGANAKTTQIAIGSETTVKDFVDSLKSAGLNANFDENLGRFFISSSSSGSDNSFKISTYTMTDSAVSARNSVLDAVGYSGLSDSDKSSVNGAISLLGKGVNASEKQITDAKNTLNSIAESNAKNKVSTSANNLMTGIVNATTADEEAAKTAMESEEVKKAIDYFSENGVNADTISSAVSEGILTQEQADAIGEYDTTASLAEETVLATNAVNDAVEAYSQVDSNGGQVDALSALGLGNITGEAMSGSGMTVVAAQDSEIVLDGAKLTGTTNSFSANGMTFELNSVTDPDETISLNISNDTEGVYNQIKEFITGFNEVLKEMNTAYYANSARNYDPLTSDEKEAMTDDEIEKWETKIKDSLLRRDSTLGSLITSMRNALTQEVEVDGQKYSLLSFGISTSTDYSEKGLLHIAGDASDSTFADKTDKLKAALTADPEKTAQALSEICKNLYSTMTDKMKSTKISSALTFYNDKKLKSDVTDYNKKISDWEEKLQDLEDKYYKQFSAMEKAMESMNSQSTYLTNLFGG